MATNPAALPEPPGVSFVVPVLNGARWLATVLDRILDQADGRPFEIVAVDDGSTDGSLAILHRYAARGVLRLVPGPGLGAAAALNAGLAHARYPLIAQVDQDVLLEAGWLARLVESLASPDPLATRAAPGGGPRDDEPGDAFRDLGSHRRSEVAAAQGRYVTPRPSALWARVSGLDLEERYARIRSIDVDHVCTGNSLYRASALRAAGGFDASLGYGYDNDLSYRLGLAGHRLVFCREATSVHRWPETGTGYLAQQYGLAYGRFDLIAKHPRRLGGDDVSGPRMALHVAGAPLALAAGLAAGLAALARGPWLWPLGAGLGVLAVLITERAAAGLRAAVRLRDPAGLAFAPVHLIRDLAWTLALVVWAGRRIAGHRPQPSDSMSRTRMRPCAPLVPISAHDEAAGPARVGSAAQGPSP